MGKKSARRNPNKETPPVSQDDIEVHIEPQDNPPSMIMTVDKQSS